MILIRCCGNCRRNKDGICTSNETYKISVVDGDWCPYWKEKDEKHENEM